MNSKEWLVLNFTLSKEPSRVRVSVWRKLKKCGSISIGQSMWILPYSKEHIDIFNEISKEIIENNGTAYILSADFVSNLSFEDVIQRFNSIRNEEYIEFLEKCDDFFKEIQRETEKENFTFVELEENEYEYNKLEEWLKKIASRDFFNASQKNQSEQKLIECKKLLEEFSNIVYKLNQDV